MADHEPVEVESKETDSKADAIGAVAVIALAVLIALYWVSNQ